MKETIYVYGGMNKDSDVLEKGDFVDAVNMISAARYASNKESAKIVKGNTQVSFTYTGISGTNKVIYAVKDESTQSIYYFVYNSTGSHTILRYNTIPKTIDKIVFPVTGVVPITTDALGFVATPTKFSAVVINGLLIWADGTGMKSINIQRAYNTSNLASVTAANRYVDFSIDSIRFEKIPPFEPIRCQYFSDISYKRNNIKAKPFQFAYQYVYLDNEVSVISEFSSVPLPQFSEDSLGDIIETEGYNNCIDLDFSMGGHEVKKVYVYARELDVDGVTGSWFKIDTIEKYNENGTAAIATEDYSILFYNDIARVYTNELLQNDFTPKAVGCVTTIDDNKLLVGDYTEGYNLVKPSCALTLTEATINTTSQSINLDSGFRGREYGGTYYYHGYVKLPLPGMLVAGDIIYLSLKPGTGSPTVNYNHTVTSAEVATYTLLKTNITAALAALGIDIPIDNHTSLNMVGNPYYLVFFSDDSGTIPVPIDLFVGVIGWEILSDSYVSVNALKTPVFKAGAYHEFGLVYKDKAKRKTSVIADDNFKIYVPFDTEMTNSSSTTIKKYNKINWQINHLPPSWATSYSWVYFPNTTLLTFRQFFYKTNQLNVNENDIRLDDSGRLRIKINRALDEHKKKFKINMPSYVFQKGDRIRFIGYFSTTTNAVTYLTSYQDVEIFGFDANDQDGGTGDYEIIIKNWNPPSQFFNASNNTTHAIYEIYTPSLQIENRIAYEIESFEIESGYHMAPTQDQTGSLPATGTFNFGTNYLFTRSLFYGTGINDGRINFEHPGYSDYYNSAAVAYGHPNVISDIVREKRFFAGLRHSEQAIKGTQINGLSTFLYDAFNLLNEVDGEIMTLHTKGDIVHVRQTNKVTSFYVGKQVLKTADGQDIPVESVDRILGAKHVSETSYGIQHPFSYAASDSYEFFFDVKSGVVIMSGYNGMVPISENGMSSEFKSLAKKIREGSYRVLGAYDNLLECYLIFVSKVSDVSDSVCYMYNPVQRKWKGGLKLTTAAGLRTEMFCTLGDNLVSFANGQLYLHGYGSPSTFYGEYSQPNITISNSAEFDREKVFKSISIATNASWGCPNFGDILINGSLTHRLMKSRLKASKFVNKNGRSFASFLRNATTSSSTPSEAELLSGIPLRGTKITVKLTTASTAESFLTSVDIEML